MGFEGGVECVVDEGVDGLEGKVGGKAFFEKGGNGRVGEIFTKDDFKEGMEENTGFGTFGEICFYFDRGLGFWVCKGRVGVEKVGGEGMGNGMGRMEDWCLLFWGWEVLGLKVGCIVWGRI